MNHQNLICLVIDGLRASALGAYGAAACETPALDRLASQSFLFDQALIDQPDLTAVYRGFWQGLPAVLPENTGIEVPSLPAWLAERNYQTLLVTDEPLVAEHSLANEFQAIHLLAPGEQRSAADLSQTQFARVFAEALDVLDTLRKSSDPSPFCLWVHAQGMLAPWDAPLKLRQSLADDEDPTPPTFTTVPELRLPEDYDPDELLGITQAYAGQVMALDTCLAALMDHLEASPIKNDTILMLCGSRGFPLGEHYQIGMSADSLYSELLHIPCLCRFGGEDVAGFRSPALIEPADWPRSLVAMLSSELPPSPLWRGQSWLPVIRGEAEELRNAVLVRNSAAGRAIRTAAWHLCWRGNEPPELFVKPDDRWETNEISDRCPEIVSGLQEGAEKLETAILENTALPALDADLTTSG